MAARLARLLVALGLLLGVVVPSAAAAVVRPPTSQEIVTSVLSDCGAGPANARSYFGARYYRADIGRFSTVDPELNIKDALGEPQRWNRYAYVTNNPLRHVDPDGRDVVPVYLPTGNGKLSLTFLDTRIADKVARVILRSPMLAAPLSSLKCRTRSDQQDMIDKYPNLANKTFTSPHMVGLAFDVRQSEMTRESPAALGKAAKTEGFANVTVNGTREAWHFQANEFITRRKGGRVDEACRTMLKTNQAQAEVIWNLFRAFGLPLSLPLTK